MVIEHWLLAENELALLRDRTTVGRLGFSLCLKFFQQNGYFPKHHKEIPEDVVLLLSENLGVSPELFFEYRFSERAVNSGMKMYQMAH